MAKSAAEANVSNKVKYQKKNAYQMLFSFLVNAALGSTPLSSPLDSPDVLNTLVPLSDIGIASASIGSIKMSSLDSINLKNQHQQQVRLMRTNALGGYDCGGGGGVGGAGRFMGGDGNIGSGGLDDSCSGSFENLQRLASTLASRCSTRMTQTTHNSVSCSSQTNSPATHRRTLSGGTIQAVLGPPGDSATSLRSLALGRRHMMAHQLEPRPLSACRAYNASNNNSSTLLTCSGSSLNTQTNCSGDHLPSCKCLTAIPEVATEANSEGNGGECKAILLKQHCGNMGEERYLIIDGQGRCCVTTASLINVQEQSNGNVARELVTQFNQNAHNTNGKKMKASKLLEFSLSSVGRSFIDEGDLAQAADSILNSLNTPDTPTPKLSPSQHSDPPLLLSSRRKKPEPDTFSNDFVPTNTPSKRNDGSRQQKTRIIRKNDDEDENDEHADEDDNSSIPLAQFGGSWDLLELDLNFHEVNLDTCYDTDVEEYIFHGDEKNMGTDNDDDDDIDDMDDEDEDKVIAEIENAHHHMVDDPFGVLPTKPTPPDSLDL